GSGLFGRHRPREALDRAEGALARITREHPPTLTPALSLSEGEGDISIPSHQERERAAVRAETLASSGEARAETVRGSAGGVRAFMNLRR
ncbi:MAG: hypothetical protein ACRD1P_05665, partial [Thermoanaerobaculia bacterium]